MPIGNLLPEFLQQSTDVDEDVLRECRHCGSKFEQPVDHCPICGSTEIATYELPGRPDEENEESSERDTNAVGARPDNGQSDDPTTETEDQH